MSASENSDPDVGDLRRELEGLRVRVDELEIRLETRMSAIELKAASDLEYVMSEIRSFIKEVAGVKSGVGNLESMQRANHMAQIHLWGVTARYMKIPEADIKQTQRQAEEALHFGR